MEFMCFFNRLALLLDFANFWNKLEAAKRVDVDLGWFFMPESLKKVFCILSKLGSLKQKRAKKKKLQKGRFSRALLSLSIISSVYLTVYIHGGSTTVAAEGYSRFACKAQWVFLRSRLPRRKVQLFPTSRRRRFSWTLTVGLHRHTTYSTDR